MAELVKEFNEYREKMNEVILSKNNLVARQMMTMTNKLNDEYFPYSGKAEDMSTILTVTCYSCHNGNTQPETRPRPKKLTPFDK